MKQTATLIVLFLFIVFYSCNTEQAEKYTDVYVFIDITDSASVQASTYQSSIPEILKTIGVDTSSGGYSGGEVKFFLINDISNSQSEKIVLKRGNKGLLGQNPFDRLDEIKDFQSSLKKQLDKILRNADWEKSQSKIYQNLCRELANLKSAPGDKKIAIVFSDMLENSSLFSFYETGISKVSGYVKDIEGTYETLLSKDCSLPELSEIDIYLIAHRTVENDEKINLAEKFWSALFEFKKAKVRFDSELDIY